MNESKKQEEKKWLIWSFEHNAWWMPGQRGYTQKLLYAGQYTHEQALEIVTAANRFCRKEPNEAMLPVFTPIEQFTIGDRVLVEEAWEDETGNYHDSVGVIMSLRDSDGIHGSVDIDFSEEPENVREFLRGSGPYPLQNLTKIK